MKPRLNAYQVAPDAINARNRIVISFRSMPPVRAKAAT